MLLNYIMINLDSLTLKLFLDENIDFFVGAKIQKIQQPGRNELIFFIRNNGKNRKFYINFNPAVYHLCFMSEENEKKRNLFIPKTAPMFCMLLRKYILNAKIIKVDIPKFERIFEIYFEYYDELNEKSVLCLAIELMGKYSNVILYNYDTNVIIGCAHNVSAEKSKERELSGLLPYTYPKKQRKINILKTSFENFKNNILSENYADEISQKYYYITKFIVNQTIENLENFSILNLYNALKDFISLSVIEPCIKDDFLYYSVKKYKDYNLCSSINEMIDNYFSYHQMVYLLENMRAKVSKVIDNNLKKLTILEENQLSQIQKLNKAMEYKTKADVIMANSYFIKNCPKEISLKDFDNNDLLIELDENLSAVDNANKYYKMYKKAKSAYEHAENLIQETKRQILYFAELKFYSDNSNSYNELEDIYNEIYNKPEANEKVSEKIDFIDIDGYRIYIGKNKKQNDYILSKLSSAEDLWFHPLNVPGAHVIIKTDKIKEKVPDNVILKAAQLTKEFSSQKNNSKTSIIYTKRKYVKKANNKLAFVTYKNEIEVIL